MRPGHVNRSSVRLVLLLGAIALAGGSFGCGDDDGAAAVVLADDIPVAHTPPGGYGATLPPPILAGCTEPLVEGAPDLRGTWRVVAVERGGRPVPATDPVYDHVERVEQCGNRLIVVGGGVIHDMRVDGTAENGVNDVSATTFQPIQVVATFEDGVHVLRPVGIVGIEVTRELDGDEMIWNYVGFTARLQQVDPED